MYSVQCTVYSIQCTLYSVQCTVYSVQCTVYSIQCTVYLIFMSCLRLTHYLALAGSHTDLSPLLLLPLPLSLPLSLPLPLSLSLPLSLPLPLHLPLPLLLHIPPSSSSIKRATKSYLPTSSLLNSSLPLLVSLYLSTSSSATSPSPHPPPCSPAQTLWNLSSPTDAHTVGFTSTSTQYQSTVPLQKQ